MAMDKIVLAYSGGLDTSVAVPWLKDKYNADIITLTIDLGMVDLESIRQRALQVGAAKALTVDGRATLVDEFLFPALKAGAIYEEQYPLATALGRPLIARYLAESAQAEGAFAVAHGCTGKGNDQVRIEVGIGALAPDVQVIAPIRDWGMSRQDEIEYANQRGLPINPRNSKFSVDENLWGRSCEAGELEDPWLEPPEEAYDWTSSIEQSPSEPAYVELGFDQGLPVAVDGEQMAGIDIINHLNTLAGSHGVGRIDHVENRLVGIKSREIYESPAAVVLARRAQSVGNPDPFQGPGPDQGPHRPGVRRPGLQRLVVHRPPARPGRLRRQHPALRHRRGESAAAQGQLHRSGPQSPPGALQLLPGHLRQGGPVRPFFRPGVHLNLRFAGAYPKPGPAQVRA